MSRLNVANFRHPDGTVDNINITSGGDVGIGTSSPNNNYGTNLAVHDSGTTGARLKLSTSGTGEGNLDGFDLITTGNNAYITNRESGTLALATNNTTAAEVASGGEFRFNSGYGSVATAYGARAWIRFDGSAATIGSGVNNGNMDAVTDNGTGDYTVNFTNDMPDANYAIIVTSADTGTTSSWTSGMSQFVLSQAAGSCRIVGHHGTDNGEARNTSNVNVVVFR